MTKKNCQGTSWNKGGHEEWPLGDPPWDQMTKKLFFVRKLPGIREAMRVATWGPSLGPNDRKNIFCQGTSWNKGGHEEWPLGDPPRDQMTNKIFFVRELPGISVAMSGHLGTLPGTK